MGACDDMFRHLALLRGHLQPKLVIQASSHHHKENKHQHGGVTERNDLRLFCVYLVPYESNHRGLNASMSKLPQTNIIIHKSYILT